MNIAPQIAADRDARHDELWYKDAIVYQLHVKAFADSNGDGIGDFAGLTERLDYLHELGVTALWLLPFYPSPGRDDGYDIADYRRINPDFGSMKDFRRFIVEAKRRGLRVITELVVNHTSDEHPWFKRARRSSPQSDARAWYVWSDNDRRYAGTRIIFNDTEKSNWAWDDVAQAYYWHRFFSHQPDLNYDNPRVLWAILQVIRRWLDLGVDGFRLDAIPYLCDGRSKSMAGGRAGIFRPRRRMPHGLSFPADAADLHGDRAGRPVSDHRHPAPDAGYPGQLPVGAVPAQSRRADAGNGDRFRTRLSLVHLRVRSARPHQSRHPPTACALDGQRPAQDRAHELAAAVVSGNADHLLWRRDRDGRQHLSRRPQRRAHADAMDARPQRRILARRPGHALPAAHHGPGLRLSGGQRRSPVAQPVVPAQLDQASHLGAQDKPGIRPRHDDVRPSRQPRCARLRAPV